MAVQAATMFDIVTGSCVTKLSLLRVCQALVCAGVWAAWKTVPSCALQRGVWGAGFGAAWQPTPIESGDMSSLLASESHDTAIEQSLTSRV
jgi:hypothetical protein